MKKPKPPSKAESYQCDCALCVRNRKFDRIITKLNKTDREWMDHLYNYFYDIECELEMVRARKKRGRK